MSAVATRERPVAHAAPDHRAGRTAPLFDDGLTLEDLILRAWEELIVEGSAACPVCGGALGPDGCADCGSELR